MTGSLEKCKQFFLNVWVHLALRLILGLTFIAASIDKVSHPKQFAEAIYSYQLLPLPFINFAAIAMAMIELVVGITLILGIWTRASSFILSGLLAVFIVAISINLIRGLEINCGCFEVISDSKISVDLLVRDILLLISGAIIFFNKKTGVSLDSLLYKQKVS